MMRRFVQSVPMEIWAMLLILLPLLWRVMTRIELIDTNYHLLRGPADPDPWLRLTLVRDWLMGGGWFNHEVLRSNAPYGGISTPWTRPLDVVIAGLVKIQPAHLSLDVKLLRAAAALPLIWVTLLLLGTFRAIRQFPNMPSHTPLLATALTATIPLMWNYFGQGNADHHAPLTALWAWVLSYSLMPAPRARDCWVQGILLALMLWISPEALVLIGLIYAIPAIRWIITGERAFALVQLTSATAYGSIAALLAERAPGTWLVPIYDSISIVHVVLLVLCALAMRLLVLLSSHSSIYGRAGLALAAGLAITAMMGALYPLFFHGPMAEVDPYIFTNFLPRIVEAKSLFTKPTIYICAVLFLPAVALLSYGWMLQVKHPLVGRNQALSLLALVLVTTALCMTQQRWNYYLFPVLAIMLAPLMGSLFTPDTHWPSRLLLPHGEITQAMMRIALVLLLLGTPNLLMKFQPNLSSNASRNIDHCEKAARELIYSGALTKALGPEPLTLYAPTNLGGEILFFTPYKIVASNYHREGKGLRYLWDGLKITDLTLLKAHLAERKIDAILTCPDAAAPQASSLLTLTFATLPTWIKQVPLKNKYQPRVYKIY